MRKAAHIPKGIDLKQLQAKHEQRKAGRVNGVTGRCGIGSGNGSDVGQSNRGRVCGRGGPSHHGRQESVTQEHAMSVS